MKRNRQSFSGAKSTSDAATGATAAMLPVMMGKGLSVCVCVSGAVVKQEK